MPSITVLRDPRRLHLAIFLLAAAPVVLLAAGCAAAAPAGTSTPDRTGGAARPAATAQAAATRTFAGRTCGPPYPTGIPSAQTVFCADPAAMTAARVLRIVDGDTLHVELGGRDETVRLYGTNATERGQPCSDEATRRLHELAGGEVRLRADARERDRFSRLLRYVYSTSGLSIDAEMVDEGLAHAWRSDGDLRFAIIALETRASVDHRGCLWH